MNFAAQNYALAAPTGAVLAGIGKHHALAQGGGEDGFSFIHKEGFFACIDTDFELLHADLPTGSPIVADQG